MLILQLQLWGVYAQILLTIVVLWNMRATYKKYCVKKYYMDYEHVMK